MNLSIMPVGQLKSVYTDDFQSIFIASNRQLEQENRSDNKFNLRKYLYASGQFFNISGASPVLCTKCQHSFLLGLMTNFGSFK